MLKKLCDTKIIRTRYELHSWLGLEARGFKVDMADIPDNAKLIEIWESEDKLVLTFEVEANQPL